MIILSEVQPLIAAHETILETAARNGLQAHNSELTASAGVAFIAACTLGASVGCRETGLRARPYLRLSLQAGIPTRASADSNQNCLSVMEA